MLVPLSDRYGLAPRPSEPSTRYSALAKYRELPAAASDMVPVPGATRSGLAAKSIHVGPAELYGAIWSSARVTVPSVEDAPTVRTHGEFPGAVMPPSCGLPSASCPRLPAAATTVIPLSATAFAASV